jgi:hypothetical protein
MLDRIRCREVSVRTSDDDRLAGGDLPLDLRDDQPEPGGSQRQVLADQQWRTVQEEDRQNKELLKLSNEQDHQNTELLGVSNQILTLTKEVRSFAEKAREDSEQNTELLDVSKRTLALTQEVHAHAGPGNPTDSGTRPGG